MITLNNVTKLFRSKPADVVALHKVNLHIGKGEFVLIKGPSGCGKSTLLFALGGMLRPTSGKILFEDKDLYAAPVADLLHYRARRMGFVYQAYHLVPYLDILENVLLVNRTGRPVVTREEIVAMARTFHLEHRLFHFPAQLSVGEKQRAALMRALAVHPKLLIADEPTGNLDPENSRIIMEHFKTFQEAGGTVVMASHGNEADAFASRMVRMNEGEIVE